ncbi:FHA domain-containing protein [Streptomyces bathyalis]
MTYVPADQSPQPNAFSRPGVQNDPGPQGQPGPPPHPPGALGQQGPPQQPPGALGQQGPPPPPPFPGAPSQGQQQQYDFDGSNRPSEVNRPAEPLTPDQPPQGFGGYPGQGQGQGPGPGGPGPGGPGPGGPGPGGPGQSQGQGAPMAPPAPGGPQQPSPPSGDWAISPPVAPPQEQQPPGPPPFQGPGQGQDFGQGQPPGPPPFQGQDHGQGQPPGPPQQHQFQQQPGAGLHDQGQQMQPPGPSGSWVAVIAPDREYFAAMLDRSGPEASNLNLPAYSPEQQLPLSGNQITIGRRRHSTGEAPDIDLARTPEDPGVSHQHAVLVQQPDGSWSVVDQDSTNGTTINGAEDPIQPFVPVPLKSGDRVHVGAWTTITLHLT